jgi:hypothetical protein
MVTSVSCFAKMVDAPGFYKNAADSFMIKKFRISTLISGVHLNLSSKLALLSKL